MKTIQILTSYALSDAPAVRNRLLSKIKTYLDMGHYINLVSADLNFNLSDYGDFQCNGRFSHTSVLAGEVVSRNFFKRAVDEIILSLRLYFIARRSRSDITLVTVPSMFLIFTVQLISNRRFTVLDIRDLTWKYIPATSTRSRFIKRVLERFMTIGLRSASVITVTNSAEFDYVKKVGFSKPIFQLKNGIGRQTFDQLSVIGPKEPSKTLHVVYVGTVGIAQNLITLVRAASKLPEVNFTIVGEGIELSSLRESVCV